MKKSNNDATTTINIIEDVLKMQDLTLFNRINHQLNSKKAGLDLPMKVLA